MIKAVIFDMDGVLVDSEPLHFQVDLEVLHALEVQADKDYLEQFVGWTNPELWAQIKKDFSIKATVEEIIDLQSAKKRDYLKAHPLPPMEGILPLLQFLKGKNIPIALGSSSPRYFIEGVVEGAEIRSYFQEILSGEEVPKGKPEPDIFLELADRLGQNPQECAVIEDSASGVTAAKAAGMTCLGFINPQSGNQNLSRADFRSGDMQEIHQWFQQVMDKWP